MTEGRESDASDAELTPQTQGVEAFKAAGNTEPGEGAATPTAAPTQGSPAEGSPVELPTEADAASYLGLLEIAGTAELDRAAEEDAALDDEIGGDGPPGTSFRNHAILFFALALGLLILAVVVALGAGRLLSNPAASPDDTAAPAEGHPPPGATASDSCVLEESAIRVASALTETITMVDSTKTTYVGTSTFTNTTTSPVYLNLKGSQNFGVPGEAPTEDWLEYQILVPPGAEHAAELHVQTWSNRAEQTWKIVTGYVAYPATDQCVVEVGGSEQLEALTRAVDNPLPVGP